MKSGTTTLFRWLGSLPQVQNPGRKEIDFFSDDGNWGKGISWYRSHFPDGELMSGESSPSYTYPENAEKTAARIYECYPSIPMIYVVRDPVERARSHYRHEVQRGRENRTASEAISVDSIYIERSLYARCLAPYLTRFRPDQLLVVRFEDLVSSTADGWEQVLPFLGLPSTPLPGPVHTPSAEKPRYSPLLIKLWKAGALRPLQKLPGPVRKLGKRLLTSQSTSYEDLLASSREPLHADVDRVIREDAGDLELSVGKSFWPTM